MEKGRISYGSGKEILIKDQLNYLMNLFLIKNLKYKFLT
jgi:hypothetical protein